MADQPPEATSVTRKDGGEGRGVVRLELVFDPATLVLTIEGSGAPGVIYLAMLGMAEEEIRHRVNMARLEGMRQHVLPAREIPPGFQH